MDTSPVSEQERQSQDAVSMSESAMFPLDKPESEEVWSPVLFELPVNALSLGLAKTLMGLGGLRTPVLVTQSWFWFLVLSQACSHHPKWSCAHSSPSLQNNGPGFSSCDDH